MQDNASPPVERRKPDETIRGERLETIEEISDLLAIIQKMGHRLSYETHNQDYDLVADLNQILHEARLKMLEIQNRSSRR